MIDDKVSIGPGFEFGVEFGIVTIAYLLVGSVEMFHIVQVEVGGGDVGSAAEPPDSSVGFKVSIVEMHGGTVGVAGMHDAGETAGEEGDTFARSHALGAIDSSFGGRLQCLLGHGSVNNREVDTGLFPDFSIFENAGHASSAVGAGPAIFLEGGSAVDAFDIGGDGFLCFAEHLFEACSHGVVSVGSVSGAY